jgi:protoporphyrin/coproporphyrin ferrochelatase
MAEVTGLLVMAYGTARDPEDIERYYTDIRGGRPPSPELLEELRERYAAIGNRFPLTEITERQASGLAEELGEGWRAYVGMKHSPPFVGDAVRAMAEDGIRRAVGIVMAPHYSRMSIGGYIDRVEAARPDELEIEVVRHWHDHPAYLDVLAAKVGDALDRLTEEEHEGALVVFTAHSLPSRIVDEGDPYPDQLRETAEGVAARLDLPAFTTGWQSAGRTPEPWLGPPLEELIPEVAAKGHPAVVVAPCGFVSDHLEILYDLDIEAQEIAREAGIRLERTESMNDDPAFLRALGEIVRGVA